MAWTEWVGYGASLLIATSLMMSSVVRLRWLNLAGAAVFTAYGVLVEAYPVAVLNALMVGVNAWHLMRMLKQEEHFVLLPVAGLDSGLAAQMLAGHEDELTTLFPGWRSVAARGIDTTVILRDLTPAGVVVWSLEGETARIHVDWVRPAYRDLKCARFFLESMTPSWHEAGIRRVASPAGGQTHRDYLQRLGFRVDRAAAAAYVRDLAPPS